MASIEIHAVSTVSGNQPRARRIIEDASQTFLPGTPVEVHSTNGAIMEWDGSTVADAIAGFSLEQANNLSSAGSDPTTANPGVQPFERSDVPNEASAVTIGRPLFADGRIGFEAAAEDTIFRGQVGPSQTTAATDVGVAYGLTKDSDNHWYVDKTKTTVNAVVTVVKLDPWDTTRGVWFVVLPAAAQLTA